MINVHSQVAWKANGIEVVSSLTDGVDHDIMIIKDIIPKTNTDMLDFLSKVDNVSIFTDLLERSPLVDLVDTLVVKEVCFAKDICLKVKEGLKNSFP